MYWMRTMKTQTLTIRVDEYLPHSVAKVWRALTDSDLLARWLMPNDFKLEPVVMALGRWGVRFMDSPHEGDFLSPTAFARSPSASATSRSWS